MLLLLLLVLLLQPPFLLQGKSSSFAISLGVPRANEGSRFKTTFYIGTDIMLFDFCLGNDKETRVAHTFQLWDSKMLMGSKRFQIECLA